MSKNINIIFIFTLSVLLSSCGFKKISQIDNQIYLQNVNVQGESRIAYLIKNDILLISNKDAEIKYDVDLTVLKNKSVKIKDKTGKITRYSVGISGDLSLKNNDSLETTKKSFYYTSDYEVETNHTKTISNEKKAFSTTVQRLSEEIINYITIYTKTK